MALLFKVSLLHPSLFWLSDLDVFPFFTSLNEKVGSEQAAGGSEAGGGFLNVVAPSGFAGCFSGVSPTAVTPHTSFLQK